MNRTAVIVATYGDRSAWDPVAARAIASARAQTREADDLIRVHAATLAEARNRGAEDTDCDLLVFLDADDEIGPTFLQALDAAVVPEPALYQPATLGVYDDSRTDPEPLLIAPAASLLDRNHMVIGTAVRRDQFLRVGGFAEWPYAEDWELWLRCVLDGARQIQVPGAIYRVHVNPAGRNNGDARVQLDTYHAIRNRHMAAWRAKGLP